MAAFLCTILCTNCGDVYDNLIDREHLHDSINKDEGVMESHNYRCENTHRFVRIRRFYTGNNEFKSLDDILNNDEKLNICPGCHNEVPSFGDRYHVELGNLDAVLKQKCPRCHKNGLMLLERREVKL